MMEGLAGYGAGLSSLRPLEREDRTVSVQYSEPLMPRFCSSLGTCVP